MVWSIFLQTSPCLAVCDLEQMVRLVMERQGASEVLLRALCLSVPYDQAFVLEVHRDVLKSRLRYTVLAVLVRLPTLQK